MIKNLREQLDNGQTTKQELFNNSIERAKKYEEYNSFVTLLDSFESVNSDSILNGIPYAIKDNFSTSGILTTASSNILSNYVPVFDATVYKKLKESGATLVGKNTLDELAMGGTGTTGHTGVVRNPYDKNRLIGGSSAGGAACVAQNIVPFSIGSDTGDSVRKPAAFGGVVGFKPTYGRISRYGLFAFASSLDHVGILSNSVEDAAIVTDLLKGSDPLDMTSLEDDNIKYTDNLNNDIKGKKLFYLKDICNPDNYEGDTKETLKLFFEKIEELKTLGFIVEEVEMNKELLSAIYPSYMAISCAEATSNNANLNGVLFGNKKGSKSVEDIMFETRTEGFSELIKRRFVIGSYILQKENQERLFLNAKRVRRLVVDNMNKLFEEYDGFIMPASSSIAPLIEEASETLTDEHMILENHLAIGNFGGYPSITIPTGFVSDMPVAINLTGPQFKDSDVLNMAYIMEQKFEFKGGFDA